MKTIIYVMTHKKFDSHQIKGYLPLQVGKEGIGDALVKQVDDALTAREMIKIRVLNNQELSSREIADQISATVDCDVVQVIGTRVVLFRRNPKKGAYDFCL